MSKIIRLRVRCGTLEIWMVDGMDVVRIGSLGYWNIRIYETTLRVGLWILFFGFLSVGVFERLLHHHFRGDRR